MFPKIRIEIPEKNCNFKEYFKKFKIERPSIESVQIFRIASVLLYNIRSSCLEVFCKKGVLTNFAKFRRVSFFNKVAGFMTGKHLYQSLFFNKVFLKNFINKETMTKVFSCELCEISKNTFRYRTSATAASDNGLFAITNITIFNYEILRRK